MRDALNKTGKPIVFAMCQWGEERVWEWGMDMGNSWRTTLDISNSFASMKFNFWQSKNLGKYAGPGGWNDPDMLEVGNNNMTIAEQRTHFAIWCIHKFILILGTDLTQITDDVLTIITAKDLIATN